MEEKKVYNVVGTVTIGTDEYRDLLTEKFEAERKAHEENERWYKEYRRANDLEKQVNALTEKMKKCETFLRNHVADKETDASVTLFGILFGEE